MKRLLVRRVSTALAAGVILPLPTHPNAFQAAEAAMCAGYRKKLWEMHHLLFANQQALAAAQLQG